MASAATTSLVDKVVEEGKKRRKERGELGPSIGTETTRISVEEAHNGYTIQCGGYGMKPVLAKDPKAVGKFVTEYLESHKGGEKEEK